MPDCGKKQHYGGLCSMHAERKRLHGTASYEPRVPQVHCDIQGCEKPHFGRGYCLAHYKRLNKYGDPLAGGIKWGEAQKFLLVATKYEGDGCLTWPYGTNGKGYGRVNYKNVPSNAHVVITEIVHGPKPTPRHEVCHSCGNGHKGCVNPKHMRWGTRKDNVQDAIIHGTAMCYGRPIPGTKR